MTRLAIFAVCLVGAAAVAGVLWMATVKPSGLPASQAPPTQFVQDLGPGQRFCINSFFVPAGARSLAFTIGTPGRRGSAIAIAGTDGRTTVFRGGRRFREGQDVSFRIDPSVKRDRVLDLCVRNRGRGLISFAGDPQVGVSARVGGTVTRTWLESAGSIAGRFQWARFSPLGAATLWLALAIALASSLLAVSVAVIAGRRRP